ncbi:MAG: carboxypeptidase-like regulatory domain-containing protein [Crocinitomicaceae bacterium]
MIKGLFFALFIFIFHSAFCQQKYTVSGYIKDSKSSEAIIGARVYCKELEIGTVTNVFGFFSLTLPAGKQSILFSFVGYEPQKKEFTLNENLSADILLVEGNLLGEIVVTAEELNHESTEISTINLSMEKVKTLPVLLGEIDILKTAALLPGIHSGSEGSSGIYVRGGGPDQNLILLDGVPIYNANHLFGFFSVFNADAINSVKIIKGGFPARYGGRLSSVIDINMIEGNMKEYHAEGSVGLISSKLMLSGPIMKDKMSFMVSGRRTYIDVLARPIINAVNNQSSNYKTKVGYFFYDLNGKINYKVNDKNRIYLSAYMGKDKFYLEDEFKFYDYDSLKNRVSTTEAGMNWGNKIFSARWNHQYNAKLLSNLTVNFSNYEFVVGFADEEYYDIEKPEYSNSFQYLSGIKDVGAKLDYYYYPNPKHKIQFGTNYIRHQFSPGVGTIISEGSSSPKLDSTFGSAVTNSDEFYVYVEDDYSITKRISANFGLHFSNLIVNGKYYNSLQPRAAINYLLNEKSSVKLSYASMTQFLHLLSNTSIGLPTDFWVPATENTPPQRGHQIAAGYALDFKKGYALSVEGYYKTMTGLIEYKEGASFLFGGGNWENLIERGKGWSYGGEILLEKKIGKLSGWIGYTLSWTNRQFENLNFGKVYPYRYDRRHDISVAATYKINDKWDVGVVWVYGTGNSLTLPVQQYQQYTGADNQFNYWWNPTIENYESKNDYRMPAYHRLDIGFNKHKIKKWGEVVWSYGLYNAYNRQNPFYIEYGYLPNDISPNPSKVLKQLSLFPVIPSISYSVKF